MRIEVAVARRGRDAAWAAALVDGRGRVAWTGAERTGPGRTDVDAYREALSAAREAARRLRRRPGTVVTDVRPTPEGAEAGEVARAAALARSLLPAEPSLPSGALTRIGPWAFVAHGTRDYRVDLAAMTCTCPRYRYSGQLCKHLRAALALQPPAAG